MNKEEVIVLKNVYKSFKVYSDKSHTITERILTRGRSKYKKHAVLKNVSMAIRQGEVIGLIGENGSGKSTALKLISRIIYPDQGSVQVTGRVSSLLELGAGFHPDLSGRENIYTNASIFGLSKNEIDNRINDIIDFSELWDFIDNPVRTYSSGMYMRLAFSVAINVDADILLIDEILAVGDKNFQQKCFEKLEELKNNGVTIVIVTHDISTVERFCTRVIWMHDGNVVSDDLPSTTIDKYYDYMVEKQLLLEKRKQEEQKKNQLAKKDFTREDITALYKKYLNREPENEEVFNSYFENFDKIKDIEQQIKNSFEYRSFLLNNKQKKEREEQEEKKKLTRESVIKIYLTYLLREPESEQLIEACCNAYKDADDLIQEIKKSSEYKEIIAMESKNNKDSNNIDLGIPKPRSVVIKGIFTADSTGIRTKDLVNGTAATIILDYRVNKPQEFYAFGIEILTSNSVLCTGSNTLQDRIKIKQLNETGSVIFKISRLDLQPGNYKLYASVLDKNGKIIDNERRFGEFTVIAKDAKTPIYNLEHSWIIK